MKPILPFGTLLFGAAACGSDDSPTQPPSGQLLSAAVASAGSWSARAAFPGHGLEGAAVAMAPNAAGESVVYLLGGSEGEFDVGYPVQAYTLATDSWTTLTAKVDVWRSNGAGKLGNRIYFSGGLTVTDNVTLELLYSNQLWAYDYAGDRMNRKADLPIRSADGVSGVIDGKLYVLPGICPTERYPEPGYCSKRPTRRFYRYDPASDRWVTRPWAPHFHAQGAAGVIAGKLYVVGGGGHFQRATAELDVYDPATNSWKTLAPIPTAGPAIGTVIAGKLFVITGTIDGLLQGYEYSPSTNVWKRRAAPSRAHDGVVRVTLDGSSHLLAVGGGHGIENDTPNASELYTR